MDEKILLTGASGLIGSRCLELLPSLKILTPDLDDFDITKPESIERYFHKHSPTVVVHLAGYTNVAEAEKGRGDKSGTAWQINVEGTRNILNESKKNNAFFIHMSTEYVFPGTGDYPGPYSEDSKLPTSQEYLNWYGCTKLEAEKIVSKIDAKASIIRIVYPFRANYTQKMDYVAKILYLYDQGNLYPMFTDQQLTPTYIDDIASALDRIISLKSSGIHHIASSNMTNPFEFAEYLLEKARGVKGIVKRGSMKKMLSEGKIFPQPRLGGLLCLKTQEKLGISFHRWQDAIDEILLLKSNL